MANNIEVLVRDKETGNESKIPYKAYQDVSSRFILLGQVDENGNLVDGDPNLNPQHRRAPSVKSAAVANVGKVEAPQPEVIKIENPLVQYR